jgi:hypothetical protein
MSELKTEIQIFERRTYLKGKFKGKFVGHLDFLNSDIHRDSYYDIEVLSGEIRTKKSKQNIRHWEKGEPPKFQPIDKFLTKLPEVISLFVEDKNGNVKNYQINLNDPKLSNFKLTNQVHDEEKVLGDIEGEISGFIKHYDEVEVEVLIEDEFVNIEDSKIISEAPIIIKSDLKDIKTKKPTGSSTSRGAYQRKKYFNADGSEYSGRWVKDTKKRKYSFWNIVYITLQILIFLFVVLPILVAGWQAFLPIIIFIGFMFIISYFADIIIVLFRWFFRLAGIALVIFLVSGLFNEISNGLKTSKRTTASKDDSSEVKTEVKNEIDGETIISNHRVWNDYNNKEYSGDLKVKLSDYNYMTNVRNNQITLNGNGSSQYNQLVTQIHELDRNHLNMIYSFFDSLRVENELNSMQFAEVIVSCIQDIPYTLLLSGECNPAYYNDEFIVEYLESNGSCQENIQYGLLTPTEFVGSLYGDCDTRSLLVFTILNHYKYDVAMLGSELYRHSILGINLPYNGLSKTIKDKQYVVWELTQKGIPPGVLSPQVSDMRFWNVNLISKNKQI